MNFTHENQSTNTYLVYKVGENETIDSMSLGMITNNSIPGLAEAQYTQMDADRFIKYNISARIPVSQLFAGPINRKRLLGVFQGVVDAMLASEEYMIDTRSILLDPDYIFFNFSSCETVMICLPIENAVTSEQDLKRFFKNIMFSAKFDQTEDYGYVAKILNYLNSDPVFSLTDFQKILNDIAFEKHSDVQKSSPVIPQKLQPQKKQVQKEELPPISPVPEPVFREREIPVMPKADKPIQPVVPPSIQTPEEPVQDTGEQKRMSMFYLLQHFSKANLELYKAQKNADGRKKPKKEKQDDAPQPMQSGFEVPGGATPSVSDSPAMGIPHQVNQEIPQRVPKVKPAAVPVPPVRPVATPTPQAPKMPDERPQGNADFGNTTYYYDDSDSETTIFGIEEEGQQLDPHLICRRNNEKIPIRNDIFRIGRDSSFNNYVLAENRYIGHSHCHIVARDGEYYIVDDNSKNHTYVDGVMITSGMEVKIRHEQIIRLANVEFEFRMF